MSRVVVVTGAGSGIGAAIARRLAELGDQAVICGRREEPLRAVAETTGAHVVVADVSHPEGVAEVINGAVETFGRLDGLVVNHGIIHVGGLADITPEQWEETLRINLTGPFLLLQAAMPHLVESRGAVVSISSEAGLRASDGMTAYSASKAGLSLLTQSVAVEYGPQGVRANVICPGWTATEMGDMEMAELGEERGISPDEAYRLSTSLVPLRRAAATEEIASVVTWLLSDSASYVNAAVIPVDGGGTMVDAATLALDPRITIDYN